MMQVQVAPRLRSCGFELPTDAARLGELRRSSELLGQPVALRARMAEDGYLFLPGYLHRDEVLDARLAILVRLAEEDRLDGFSPLMDAIPGKAGHVGLRPDLAKCEELQRLLYAGPMLDLYQQFLGGPVLHFDFTWLRVVGPGRATQPHCDIVFMGRGTRRLYTSWTPLGDISTQMGGLMVLEGSHRLDRIHETYGQKDVDRYCSNRADADAWVSGEKRWGGWLAQNPVKLRDRLGGRWLTGDFRAGDVLIFGMDTIHASLDNQTDALRLSCDSRYQLASEPADPRWVGENPVGHTSAGKQGRIC